MNPKEIILFYNPRSGKGKAKAIAKRLQSEIGFPSLLITGDTAEEAARELKKVLTKDSLVISIGGDGLFNLTLQDVVQSGIPIIVWPAGTGNDFSRTHFSGIKSKSLSSLLRDYEVKKLDSGLISFARGKKHFAQVLSAGFDSFVNQRANRLTYIKSSLKYTLATLLVILKFRPLEYDLEIDGKERTLTAMTVIVANGPTYGGGMKIVPHANPADGYLNILILKPVSKLELLLVFPKIFSGKHIDHWAIEFQQASSISIKTQAPIYADGEFICNNECSISIQPKSLTIVGI